MGVGVYLSLTGREVDWSWALIRGCALFGGLALIPINMVRVFLVQFSPLTSEKYVIFSSVGFADWFVEFKRYLNSRQNRSKNKLVQENRRDMSSWKLLAPDYGLLVINDFIMASLLLLEVINVLANSLI